MASPRPDLRFEWGSINVKEYGAQGDGNPADLPACQAAANAITGEGGGLYFPSGHYNLMEGLRPKSGTRIYGDGRASVLTCPSAGWLLGTTTNFGIINIDNKADVTITNLRIRGTKLADLTHTPKLVYSENSTGIDILDCHLENSAFEGIWQGGTASLNKRHRVMRCTVRDVGWPAGPYAALPAIQMNGWDTIVSDNMLYDVGCGIGASGARAVVSNNRINGVNGNGNGIGTGDGGDNTNQSVIGNTIEFSSVAGFTRVGIRLLGAPEDFNALNMHQCHNNIIRINGTAGHSIPYGISQTSGQRTSIQSNVIEISGRGVGISVYGLAVGAVSFISSNVITAHAETGACYGVVGIPNGAGNALIAVSSNNRCHGFTRAAGSFAYDFNANGGGTLNARMINDWTDQGYVRCGATYYGTGQVDGLPINLS